MRLARIRGYVTATIKHSSLEGWRLLLAQPIHITDEGQEQPEGPPQLVLDSLGSALHQKVLISSDGSEARKMLKDESSPARWTVLGIVDDERALAVG